MRLETCMPKEFEYVKKNNIPLVIAGGTVEYHGAHCAYGCDGLIVEELLKRIEKQREILITPTIWYSPASYAVGDRFSGTVHIEEDVFESYCYQLFTNYLNAGFRNVYVVIHHQFEQESLMPMTLCYMKAAKKAIMRFLEKTQGEGWWGSENYRNYYAEIAQKTDPFSWIKVIPTMTKEDQNATGYDHAGKYETALLWALSPQSVSIERLKDKSHWFTESAKEASEELGRKMADLISNSLLKRLV